MSDEICGNDTYANARVDAAIVQAVAESSDEPFWIYAQTSLIRWVRTAHHLAGEPEPGIRAITEIAQDKAKLQALVAKAVDRAKTPDERTEARELERWLTDWLSLDPKLISAQMTTLTCVGARSQRTTVTSRDGKHRTRIGERTGSWDLWDPSSLPPYARKAAYDALSELRGRAPLDHPDPGRPRSHEHETSDESPVRENGLRDDDGIHRHDRAGCQGRQDGRSPAQERPHAPEQGGQDPGPAREPTADPRPQGRGKAGDGSDRPAPGDKPRDQPAGPNGRRTPKNANE